MRRNGTPLFARFLSTTWYNVRSADPKKRSWSKKKKGGRNSRAMLIHLFVSSISFIFFSCPFTCLVKKKAQSGGWYRLKRGKAYLNQSSWAHHRWLRFARRRPAPNRFEFDAKDKTPAPCRARLIIFIVVLSTLHHASHKIGRWSRGITETGRRTYTVIAKKQKIKRSK